MPIIIIRRPHWGIQGAAIATILAQIISLVWQFKTFTNKNELLHLRRGVALYNRTGSKTQVVVDEHPDRNFEATLQIPDARAIMVQPMLKGTELFIGAKYEEKFGHVVLCGLGGIFVEVLKDVSSGLAPLSYEEAYSMIHSLRAYKIIQGTRGQKGVNEDKFAEIIVRLSTLLRFAIEIKEMDINPLLATQKAVIAVDARIRIEK